MPGNIITLGEKLGFLVDSFNTRGMPVACIEHLGYIAIPKIRVINAERVYFSAENCCLYLGRFTEKAPQKVEIEPENLPLLAPHFLMERYDSYLLFPDNTMINLREIGKDFCIEEQGSSVRIEMPDRCNIAKRLEDICVCLK